MDSQKNSNKDTGNKKIMANKNNAQKGNMAKISKNAQKSILVENEHDIIGEQMNEEIK